MSIKAFPLNQQEYSYNAQDVMKYYAGRNSGVFETGDNLKVSANGGLELRINTGMGWLAKDYVASVAFWNESVDYLMVDAGHDTYDRIDLVVVSWNFVQQEQNPKLIIRKGTPASSPAVPSLVNNSSTIEVALARINVAKGAITLSDSNIVDLRGNDTYCPMVYDEQTIRNAFVNCVGYADGVKKISDFPNVTPTANDKILVENGGTGKSATIDDVGKAIGINRDVLWINASPNSGFSSQNIIIDGLSNYNLIEIYFKIYLDRKYGSCIAEPSFAGILTGIGTTDGGDFDLLGNAYIACRPFLIPPNNNRIEFYNAGYIFTNAINFQLDNKTCIPLYIFGVK